MKWISSARLLLPAAVAFLALAAVAYAAVGDLTPQGCIDDNDTGADTCATSVDGLGGVGAVAVSADGRSVYTASFSDDSVNRFDRDPATGALTPQGCIDDNDTGADNCAVSVDGLDQPRGIAISPDGLSVYVTAQIDDAIVRFNRDPATGALTPAGCVDDNDAPDGPDACAESTDGLDGAIEVDVSPDNASVYVASDGDKAIVRFDRAADGALTPVFCSGDNDTGPDACDGSTDGLAGAAAVDVSPDGKSVYVASFADHAIVRYDRAASGAITNPTCIDDDDNGPDTCQASTDGLENAIGVVTTPDNKSVYAVSNGDDAITRFDRDPATGALTPQGCIDDDSTGDDPGCAGTAPGLNGVFTVATSPGGATIYASAQQAGAITRFDRAADGALTPAGCVDDNEPAEGPYDCATSTDGLRGAGWLDLSSDGTSMYVAGGADSAVVHLQREAEPLTTPPVDPPTGNGDTAAPETTITKKPKKKTTKPTGKLAFSSNEDGSTFECALKGKGVKKKLKKFKPCDSGKVKYKKLKTGKKKFQVRATDAAGNVDATPAKAAWKIKPKR